MGNISTHYSNVALDGLYGDNHISAAPSSWWLALYYTEPGNDNTGTEVDPGVQLGYHRVELPNNSTYFPDASGAIKKVYPELALPTPSSINWGVVPYWALMDLSSPSTGLPSAWGRLGGLSPPPILIGSSLSIPSNTLVIKIRRTLIA